MCSLFIFLRQIHTCARTCRVLYKISQGNTLQRPIFAFNLSLSFGNRHYRFELKSTRSNDNRIFISHTPAHTHTHQYFHFQQLTFGCSVIVFVVAFGWLACSHNIYFISELILQDFFLGCSVFAFIFLVIWNICSVRSLKTKTVLDLHRADSDSLGSTTQPAVLLLIICVPSKSIQNR